MKNRKFGKKYNRWFEFAEKTKDFSNKASDFSGYNKDLVFSEMIKRLTTVSMENEDIGYIKSTKEVLESIKRYEEGFYNYGLIDGEKKGMRKGIEKEKKRSEKIIKKAELERQKAELQASVFRYYFAEKKTVEEIAEITGKNKEYIKNILGL